MALDKITTDIIADDAVTAAKIVAGAVEADIRADAIGTAEIANDVTISTSGNIATTGSGTLTVAGATTLTGGISGNTTATGNLTVTGDIVPSTPLSHRNMIVNGGMQVSQRGTTFSPTTATTYLIDRFRSAQGTSFNFDTTITQVATGLNDTGQIYCMKVEADSVVSPTGSHNGGISYPFEGQDLQHLQYGGSNAKDMVLSFWAKVSTNAVGNYTIQVRYTDTASGEHHQYHLVSLTTTWTQYTILIAGNGTALTNDIRNTNTIGLEVFWWLSTGSTDLVSASSTWTATSGYKGITGATNFMDSADNEFYLTGVQLELGSNVTPFEHRIYTDELERCKRYFQTYGGDHGTERIAIGYNHGLSQMRVQLKLQPRMRSAPTLSLSSNGHWSVEKESDNNYACTGMALDSASTRVASANVEIAADNFVLSEAGVLRANGTTSARLNLTSEL